MAIDLRADYENANGRLVAVEAGPLVRFEAEARGGRWPLWFRFTLKGLPPDAAVTLALANAPDVLGGLRGMRFVRPVWREPAGDWTRCDIGTIDEDAGEFRFTCPTGPGEVEVAFSHPFSYSDLSAWTDRLPAEVAREELCLSPGGLSVPLLRIGEPASARHGVWIIARQHAGEAPGSFVLQGLMDYFLSPDGQAVAPGVAVSVVPMMDVDGVFRGDYGKTVAPDDFWEDWSGASRHPAVAATRTGIAQSRAQVACELLLDLHAPTPSDGIHAYGIPAPTPEREADRMRFLHMIEAASLPECPFGATVGSTVRDPALIARCTQGAQMAEHDLLALCLEFTYHRTAAGTWVEPSDLQRLGRAVGEATTQFLAQR